MPEFLAHAKATNTPVDFITTHTYGVDGGFLDEFGKEDDDAKQLATLNGLTTDKPEVQRELVVGAAGTATVNLKLRSHDVVLLSLKKTGT